MLPDEYQKLEEIYDDFKNYQRIVNCSLLDYFGYLDINKFSMLMAKLFNWQHENRLPRHQQINTDYSKVLMFLDDGKSIKFNIAVNQEKEAIEQIKEVLKNTINNIAKILDFYCDKLELQNNLPLKKINKAIPKLINWEDLEIKFIDCDEVEVCIKGRLKKKFTYKDFGCYDSRNPERSNKQWSFLKTLSVGKGEFDLKSLGIEIKKEKYRQYKSKLSTILKMAFKLDEEPFFDVKNNKEVENYKVKFKITPIPSLRDDGEIYGVKEDDSEVETFFNEETENSSY